MRQLARISNQLRRPITKLLRDAVELFCNEKLREKAEHHSIAMFEESDALIINEANKLTTGDDGNPAHPYGSFFSAGKVQAVPPSPELSTSPRSDGV